MRNPRCTSRLSARIISAENFVLSNAGKSIKLDDAQLRYLTSLRDLQLVRPVGLQEQHDSSQQLPVLARFPFFASITLAEEDGRASVSLSDHMAEPSVRSSPNSSRSSRRSASHVGQSASV